MASATKVEKLFDDGCSDSGDELHINEAFAIKYNKWREKEELQKLKDKYGDGVVNESTSSSSESSDSEEEKELSQAIGKDFLKTLSLLKAKDPIIYDKNACFFPTGEENEDATIKRKDKKKEKPLFWKDQEREVLLHKQGVFSDDEIERPKASYMLDAVQYAKEKEELRQSFPVDVSSDTDDDLFTERIVDKKEGEDLTEEPMDDENQKDDLKDLKRCWDDSNLDPDDAFLKDFLMGKKFIDPNTSNAILTDDDVSEDEKALEKQEMFEHKYNFRFEEPDEEFIKQFPRTMKDSLRRNDSRRKLKREDIKERKKMEKEKKWEEIKRLKALKRKEIEERLEQLKEITGNDKMAFDDLDLEGDFDPVKYDEKMKEMFNEEYYKTEESIQKPVFPPDEELDVENWDNWTGDDFEEDDKTEDTSNGDFNFIMDADFDPKTEFQKNMIESTRRKKSKKRSKLAELLSRKKPVFDPNSKSFEKYLEEYYKLDCEDIIDDLPVRFSYRKVVPNEFGLSVTEILSADDKQLNRWCSLKKTCQYRTTEEEMYDVQAFKKKAENLMTKKKILSSLYHDEKEDQNSSAFATSNDNKNQLNKDSLGGPSSSTEHKLPNCEKKRKRHRKKVSSQQPISEHRVSANEVKQDGDSLQAVPKHKTKLEKQKSHKDYRRTDSNVKSFTVSDDRLRAYGINPKKFKNKLKRQKT